jgi:hypothetical protein
VSAIAGANKCRTDLSASGVVWLPDGPPRAGALLGTVSGNSDEGSAQAADQPVSDFHFRVGQGSLVDQRMTTPDSEYANRSPKMCRTKCAPPLVVNAMATATGRLRTTMPSATLQVQCPSDDDLHNQRANAGTLIAIN